MTELGGGIWLTLALIAAGLGLALMLLAGMLAFQLVCDLLRRKR